MKEDGAGNSYPWDKRPLHYSIAALSLSMAATLAVHLGYWHRVNPGLHGDLFRIIFFA